MPTGIALTRTGCNCDGVVPNGRAEPKTTTPTSVTSMPKVPVAPLSSKIKTLANSTNAFRFSISPPGLMCPFSHVTRVPGCAVSTSLRVSTPYLNEEITNSSIVLFYNRTALLGVYRHCTISCNDESVSRVTNSNQVHVAIRMHCSEYNRCRVFGKLSLKRGHA